MNAILRKGWQLHDIVVRHALDRISGFAPGTEAAGDDIDFES